MKIKLIIITLFCSHYFLNAQSFFGKENIISSNSKNARMLIYSDINSDGYQDLIFAVYEETTTTVNKIAWFENNKNGGFLAQKIITTNLNGIQSIITADVDNDGNIDLLSASLYDNKILWYQNDGFGNFSSQKTVSTSVNQPSAITTADIDNDGDIDVLASSKFDNLLAWFENDGNGNFGPLVTIANGLGSSDLNLVYSSDLDNDGDMDVISAYSSFYYKLVWYENDGNGNLSSEKIIDYTSSDVVGSIRFGDIDNDNDIDIITCLTSNGSIKWFENIGNGLFGAAQLISNGPFANLKNIEVKDVDSDGDIDILSASSQRIAWYENISGNSFGSQQIISWDVDKAYSVIAEDLDNDGDIDVSSASNNDGKIAWYENDGSENFGSQQNLSKNPSSKNFILYDIDNDGDNDFISDELNKIVWTENENLGQFGITKDLVISNVAEISNLLKADIDNDNIPDFVISGLNGEISWFKNLGNGSLGLENTIASVASFIVSLSASDLNNDGNLDVLAVAPSINSVVWFPNLGGGVFGAQQLITTNTQYPSYSVSIDLDGDGDNDLVSASQSDDKIAWFKNDGLGNFGPQQIISSNYNNVSKLFTKDIDGDGDFDIIALSYLDGRISYFKNDSLGNFSSEILLTTNVNLPTFVYADDLDYDGDLDLLSSSRGDDKIAWYENVGLGNFSSQQIINSNAENTWSVATSDINNDGANDIIFSSYNEGQNYIWLGNLINYPSVSGYTFFDINNNGIKDFNDKPLSLSSIKLLPNDIEYISNINGSYSLNLQPNNYDLTYSPVSDWSLSSDSASYTLSLTNNQHFTNKNFGFTPNSSTTDLYLNISSDFTRCDRFVRFYVDLRNLGTTIIDNGILWLSIDSAIQDTMFINPPDTIFNEYNFGWKFLDIFPTESLQREFKLKIPAISNEFSLGDSLSIHATMNFNDINGASITNFNYNPIVFCSYDPNDKQVYPDRTDFLTLHDERISYKIRFQNSGNDTAINVVILDTLDINLDLNTLKLISSSHLGNLETTIHDNNYIEFNFSNIFLPDSSTNFEASQGYVIFTIYPKENLADSTLISNKAFIYFDSNPAIITNSTHNLLVSLLPCVTTYTNIESSIYSTESYELPSGNIVSVQGLYHDTLKTILNCDSVINTNLIILNTSNLTNHEKTLNFKIYPNPTKNSFVAITPNKSKKYLISVVNMAGQEKYKNETYYSDQHISTKHWSKGVYYVKITDSETKFCNIQKLIK